jgi:hypothetical protein
MGTRLALQAKALAPWVIASLVFLAAAWPGAGQRGLIAEEIQPFLSRHPIVIGVSGGSDDHLRPEAWPPYEPGNPGPPRWVSTPQWPVLAYDGLERQWPVFIRGHQTALGTYLAMGLGLFLGQGPEGWRLANVLLALGLLLCTAFWARRQARDGWLWAVAWLSVSWGFIAIARTAYSFELVSRLGMVVGLWILSRPGPLGRGLAALAAGALVLACLSRLTIWSTMLPAAAVLLWRHGPDRQRWLRALVLGASVVLPTLVLALAVAWLPFSPGTAPLQNLDLSEALAGLASAPRQLLLGLAWLGDAAHSIWEPLARGQMSPRDSLWMPALIAMVPTALALIRLGMQRAREGEKMYLAALAGATLASALVYRDPHQFQLFMAVEPLLAIAIAEQAALLTIRSWRWIGLVLILIVRLQSLHLGLSLDTENSNPMLSGKTQRALVDFLGRPEHQRETLLTTSYQHAGVLEAWTDGRLRPLHAWPGLLLPQGRSSIHLDEAWRALLCTLRPNLILLTDGNNLFESTNVVPHAIADSLQRVARHLGFGLEQEQAFPTESGSPGWSLWRVKSSGAMRVDWPSPCEPWWRSPGDHDASRAGANSE